MVTIAILVPYFPSFLRPSISTHRAMPPVLRTFCSSLPVHRLPRPAIQNPSQNLSTADLTPRLPLLKPSAPLINETILSLELMDVNAVQTICSNPDLREASVESIHRIIHYLQSKGVRYGNLARIFNMCPKILTADIKTDLAPVFDFLSKDLEVPNEKFNKVLNKCPKILATSVRNQLRPALFFLQRLGIKDKKTLAYRQPVLLVLSIERTIIPKLEFLTSLGFSDGEASVMVTRSPYLLTFSVENNFKPKLKYFFEEMKGDLGEIKAFPQFFAFSLEQRIMPRHKELVEKGLKMSLADMLVSMDFEFQKLVEKLERVKKGNLVNSAA